ncbi:hypothetical protein BRDID11004_60010 [Bradyrhizobium diazoefficiens]|uniref:Uncharacterized protein n=1 Tax=Bradyrhizobium diazoefficiens TaxID=1355477 RepID=A0A810AK33_9BRAD|nr:MULTISPECIES: hypothetical protein [Bradyrhizobium]WLB66035.1 hypothetical protein QIH96_13085 [Bradyrhizobium japonicum]BBZ93100.1 hypothetical protein F07S3_29330 [Bradyrhizobium diazoefficiens]BCA10851.1 hypothetical protein BDHF08_26980 [Bradyrhizobium diazoefficiens]BCE55186.1 hypothetical protein XF5B_26980 [Bradyrhizobium diazoefficiens]BCE63920.1 hypothetical protein XF6B_27190 [Bradyrhizobium diazoefficiens]
MAEHNDAERRAAEQQAAAKKHEEDTRKRLAEEREEREKDRNERMADYSKVKPTPTQEENDLAVSGVHLPEHEADGSQEQPPQAENKQQQEHHRTRETKPAATHQQRGDYATRAQTPAPKAE